MTPATPRGHDGPGSGTEGRPRPSSRLAWRCRRGMKELDLIFESYLADGYAHASVSQRDALGRLLEHDDQTILAWLSGQHTPPSELLEIILEVNRAWQRRPGPQQRPDQGTAG